MAEKSEILKTLKSYMDAGEFIFKHCSGDGWIYNNDFTERLVYAGPVLPFLPGEEEDVFITGSMCDECLLAANPRAYSKLLESRRNHSASI